MHTAKLKLPLEEILNDFINSAKLIFTSNEDKELVSLYRKWNNYYLVYFDNNEVVKTEKISKVEAHMQFPNLILR
jgi:hypothetical protein